MQTCYAVARGRRPGIYLNWDDCEAQILNFNGAKYKKFVTVGDAELWVNQNVEACTAVHVKTAVGATSPTAQSSGHISSAAQVFKSKPTSVAATSRARTVAHVSSSASQPVLFSSPAPVTSAAKSSARPVAHPNAIKSQTTTIAEPLVIYTHGSYKLSKEKKASAGVGVWYGDDDPRNISERCPGPQTDNCAKLTAIVRALETAPDDCPLVIMTASQYALDCLIQYLQTWKNNGWKTSRREPVKNASLIRYADALLLKRRDVLGQSVELDKVLSDTRGTGKEGADALAKRGASLPPAAIRDWEKAVVELKSGGTDPIMTQPEAGKVQSHQKAAVKPPDRVKAPLQVPQESATFPPKPTSPTPHANPRLRPPAERPAKPEASQPQKQVDPKMSQQELEMYAACLLSEEDLLNEAKALGIYSS